MNLALLAEDIIKGTRIRHYYEQNCAAVTWSPERIEKYQFKKLKAILNHAYSNIPFYKDLYTRAGVAPEMITSMSDFNALPILSRDNLQDYYNNLLISNHKGKLFKSSSSGTTGIPIKYAKDVNGESAGIAAGHNLLSLSKWHPGMRSVHVWGNARSVNDWQKPLSKLKRTLFSKKHVPSYLLSDPEKLSEIVDSLRLFRPTAIDGYANSIYEIAKFMEEHDIRFPSLQMVFTTAENLEKSHKETIANVMAPVSDLYGCGEINGIACCPVNDNKYYILDTHVVVQLLPTENEEMNDIIVTDLDNYYMPFIRYRVGDMIDSLNPGNIENQFPYSNFTRIYGRSADHFELPDGKKIFPVTIFGGTVFRKYPSITRHKVIWNGKALKFIFECKEPFDTANLRNEIARSLENDTIHFNIEITDKLLPGKSGKYRYFEIEESI